MNVRLKWLLAGAIALAWAPTLIPAAYSSVWQWSTTASSNASSDPSINWREGQPPSSVNDSARSMMAALASYRDDISGLLTTTGTSTAYLVTTNQGLCTAGSSVPNDGQQLSLTMSATNGIAPTLLADTCNAYPIQSSAGAAVPAATLINGSPYTLRFSVANSAWMLRDFYGSAFTVPLGGLVPYTGATSPNSNFVLPAGQCLSTTTYANYWVLMGSPASGSCSGGQFAIIDMRGKVPAALDNLNGTAANLLTSSSTGCGTAMTSVGAVCSNGNQSSTIVIANLPPYTPSGSVAITSPASPTIGNGSVTVNAGSNDVIPLGANTATFSFAGNPQGGTSTAMARVPPTIGITYLLRVL